MTSPDDGSLSQSAADNAGPADTATTTSSDQPTTIPIDLGTATAIGAALVTDTDPTSVFRRWGVIAAINSNGTVDVVIDGTVVPGLSRNASYFPSVGETVMLDVIGTDTSVVGAQALSPRTYNRPTGIIEPYIGTTALPDTLFLLGQAVSRTTYAALWAWAQANSRVGGGLFGAGDGSTTFTVPDFRGRSLMGVGTLAGDVYALGDIGGTAKPVIGVANLPVHNHTVTLAIADHPTHTHTVTVADHANHGHSLTGGSVPSGGDHGGHFPTGSHLAAAGPDLGLAAWNDGGSGSGSHGHGAVAVFADANTAGSHSVGQTALPAQVHTPTVTQQNVGSGTAFDVRHPFLAVNWMIWV